MLSLAVRNTRKLIREKSRTENVRIGRSFTKKPTAALMASFLEIPQGTERVRILDPGAGTGILSAAAVEAACRAGAKEIQLVCYETEGEFLPMLRNNLERIRKKCRHDYGCKLIATVKEENYVTAQRDYFTPSMLSLGMPEFDYVIANPPSLRCDKKSPEALSCAGLCVDETDLAYLFAVMGMLNLAPGGRMVVLLPVLYASAHYLDRVRHYLLENGNLLRIHLFRRAGEGAANLKKNMILVFSKKEAVQAPEEETPATETDEETTTQTVPEAVAETATEDAGEAPAEEAAPVYEGEIALSCSVDDGETTEELPAQPAGRIIRPDGSLLLLRSQYDFDMIRCMARMPQTLSGLGLRMRTGLTLESRYPDQLRDAPEQGAVPLITPACMDDGFIRFPVPGRAHQYLIPRIPSLVQRNKNMLLLKRVPAKYDRRRLVCAVYLASQQAHYRGISTSNKLNYIDYPDKREMDSQLLHGLYAVLSCDLYSDYCRMLSHTAQINATDLADLPLPDEQTLRSIGSKLLMTRQFSPKVCTTLVYAALHIAQ